MRQLARRYSQADYDPVTVKDDGELQDFVFCLHCHTVNSEDAELCVACQQPIVELPADLRDRLERISAYNDYPSEERRVDRFLQAYEDLVDGSVARVDITIRRLLTALDELIFEGYLAQVMIILLFLGIIFLALFGLVMLQIK